MLDQFFRFLFTLTMSGLFYMALLIAGMELGRLANVEELPDWVRFSGNILALLTGAVVAYCLQSRWVFRRRAELKNCGRYVGLMAAIWILHELLLTVMLAVLALSYPLVLALALCVSLGLAFLACKKYIFDLI
jgi:putative flippase GtrA